MKNNMRRESSFSLTLLDPDLTPPRVHQAQRKNQRLDRLGALQVWTISLTERLSSQDTSYLCTFHKAPSPSKKHHMVGFRKIFPSPVDRQHVHHSILSRCRLPPGQNMTQFFEPYENRPGGTCFLGFYSNPVPSHYCSEVVHEWSVGATPIFLPEHVGIPMSEDPEEYYMYQVHYDNPQRIPNLTVNSHLEIYYTDQLRKHDAGVVIFGVAIPGAPSIMIPPNSIDHHIYGHCGGSCTRTMFPPEGVQIFAGKHHTHLSGTGDRFMHLRNNRELPYLLNDDNFMFNYQPVRLLQSERHLEPGDTLIKRRLYSNTNSNGSATVGGMPTRKEMCIGLFWYYPLVRTAVHSFCLSETRSPEYGQFLGIWNTTWSQERNATVVTQPPENAGLTVEEVGSRIEWTIERRNQLQNYHRTLPQVNVCLDSSPEFLIPPGDSGFYSTTRPNVFPSFFSESLVIPYRPPDSCRRGGR